MSFDAVVYGEVKKLAKEIGELALVPSNFKAPNYVDTGTFIDAELYPKLAERFVGIPRASELERKSLPTVPASNISSATVLQVSQSTASSFRKTMADAAGNSYVVDMLFRVFRISPDATSVVYIGSTTGLNVSSTYTFTSVGNTFIAYTTNTVLVSSDALNWTLLKPPINPSAIQRAGDYLFLFGSSTTTAYITTDTVTWTAITLPASANWNQALYNGTYYIVYASSTVMVARSTDASTWTSANTAVAVGVNGAVSGSTFLLPSSAASTTAYNSTDASTWTATTMPASATWLINGNASGFVIVSGSASYKSTTGLTGSWTALTLPGTASQSDISGYFRPGYGSLWYLFTVGNSRLSIDAGSTWLTMPSVKASNSSNIKALCGSSACTVYLDSLSNSLWKTTDSGNSWSEVILPGGFVPNLIGYAPKTSTFIVVAPNFATGYITSSDGCMTWSAVTPFPVTGHSGNPGCISPELGGHDKFAVIYSTGAASYAVIYTDDGVSWKLGANVNSSNFTTQPGRCVLFKDRFITLVASHPSATASSGLLITSVSNSAIASVTSSSITNAAIHTALTSSNGMRGLASDSNTVVMVLGATSTVGLPGANILYSRDGYSWSVANLNGYVAFWDNVVWTGKFFIATPQIPITGVLGNSMTVAVSYDGANWEIVNLGEFLDAADYANVPRSLQVFSNASDEVYLAVGNVKALFKVSSQGRPRIDFIPTGINGTKYVVKAK